MMTRILQNLALLSLSLHVCVFPANAFAQSVVELESITAGTTKQIAWMAATIVERVRFAEQIGEDGARTFAESNGWIAVFDGFSKGVPQGPDQVYLSADSTVHVIEAKGGTSPLSRAYGHAQGSTEWAVESARRVRQMKGATDTQKASAQQIIAAAAEGKLQVHVVRTSHVLGEPGRAVLEQTTHCSEVAKRAAAAEVDGLMSAVTAEKAAVESLKPAAATSTSRAIVPTSTLPTRVATPKSPKLAGVADDVAGPVLGSVSKVAGPLAIGVDAFVRIGEIGHAEHLRSQGLISATEVNRVVARETVGFAGSTAGAAGGAYGGAAIGTMVCPGIGTAVGAVIGAIFGSVGGGAAGEAIGEAMVN